MYLMAIIIGTNGDNTLNGFNTDDTIYGLLGDDLIYGAGGADVLYGAEDDDDVYGGTGDDDIFGGSGNDTLRGEAGNDTIDGEAGDDLIYQVDDGGTNTVYGGIGSDHLDLSGSTAAWNFDLTVDNGTAGSTSVVATSIETLTASNFNDIIVADLDVTVILAAPAMTI